ncbi:hypothetical protein G6011_10945 [Alternaria panax]|uniref:Uncharacterized protein n=1 Tax=Alternaria panax TaxID=48097 RepID=A0AAD4ID14_9PLEO|nr:hypothetical protein G6011_10945 [Alternaria panax]
MAQEASPSDAQTYGHRPSSCYFQVPSATMLNTIPEANFNTNKTQENSHLSTSELKSRYHRAT